MVRQMMGPLAERYVEYAVDIRQSGSHLLDLINDILDISSVESGKATLPETEPVDLHQEVETCAHLLALTAEENGVAISNEVPEEAPCLVAEPRRLRQILLNLIGNSVKFSPQGTTVSVRLDVGEDGLCLQVIDRGWGMAPEQVETVFEPFVQLHPGTAKASLGTGLGLTLVRNLVEMHGGRVVLQSAPGEGTTALVRFPASRTAHRGPAPKARGGARACDLPR
jgi:signal transduction histidine kinase